MAKKANSLAHTKWMCKYHIVFTPKYRRKMIYNQYKTDLRDIIKQLCKYKGVEILEGHLMPDHVRTYAGEHTAQTKCFEFHGIFERKECTYDVRQARQLKVQIWEPAFLGRRVLCKHSRIKRGHHQKIYSRAREGGYYDG